MRAIPAFIVVAGFVLASQVVIPSEPEWSGTCIGASQGDTIKVETSTGQVVEVRIWGIDAPNTGQDYTLSATMVASQTLSGKKVTVEKVMDVEPGKIIGRVKTGGTDVAVALVASGVAMYDSRYIQNEELAKAEYDARTGKKGLWAYADPIPGWEHASIEDAKAQNLLSEGDGYAGGARIGVVGSDYAEEAAEKNAKKEERREKESQVTVVNRGGGDSAPEEGTESARSGRLSISSYYMNGPTLEVFVEVPLKCRAAGSFQFEVTYLLWGGKRTTTGSGSWADGEVSGVGRASLSEEAEIVNVRLTDASCR